MPFEVYQKTKSRVVISSGNLEPVLDGGGGNHSLFARNLIQTLNYNSGFITSSRLFSDLSASVLEDALQMGVQQTPIIAGLSEAGHLGPDFVFFQKN